jgi:sec-independent protein translocase protein TatA
MPFNIGMPELLVILLLVLLVFGAKRLPEIGQSMGKGIREFKKSFKDVQEEIEERPGTVPPARQLDRPADEAEARSGEPKKLSE